jgi:hypothetical protein
MEDADGGYSSICCDYFWDGFGRRIMDGVVMLLCKQKDSRVIISHHHACEKSHISSVKSLCDNPVNNLISTFSNHLIVESLVQNLYASSHAHERSQHTFIS